MMPGEHPRRAARSDAGTMPADSSASQPTSSSRRCRGSTSAPRAARCRRTRHRSGARPRNPRGACSSCRAGGVGIVEPLKVPSAVGREVHHGVRARVDQAPQPVGVDRRRRGSGTRARRGDRLGRAREPLQARARLLQLGGDAPEVIDQLGFVGHSIWPQAPERRRTRRRGRRRAPPIRSCASAIVAPICSARGRRRCRLRASPPATVAWQVVRASSPANSSKAIEQAADDRAAVASDPAAGWPPRSPTGGRTRAAASR